MSAGCHIQVVNCTALLDMMVSTGAVLCAVEEGVCLPPQALSGTERGQTVLLRLNVFGRFWWCKLYRVSPVLKRSLVVGMRGFSWWGSLPREERRSSSWQQWLRGMGTLQNGPRNLPLCVLLSQSPGNTRHSSC